MQEILGFRKPITKRVKKIAVVSSLVIFFAIWFLASTSTTLGEKFLPGPTKVFETGWVMFTEQSFGLDVLASSSRIGFAFLMSAIIAIPLGLLMSIYRLIDEVIEPIVDFIRYVPVPALMPIFVLWSGIGEESKFLVLFFGTFFQLVLIVKDDADQVPQVFFDVARTLGASEWRVAKDVLMPYMLPLLYDRLRVTLGWCWTYLVIAELIAVQRGIGHALKEAQRFSAADQMFVCFIVLGAIGLITDYAAKSLYKKLFPYTVKSSLHAK